MIAQSRIAAGVEQIVEIDGLMGAVEIADAEMHDARREVGALDSAARRRLRQLAEVAAESLPLMIQSTRCAHRAAMRPSPAVLVEAVQTWPQLRREEDGLRRA